VYLPLDKFKNTKKNFNSKVQHLQKLKYNADKKNMLHMNKNSIFEQKTTKENARRRTRKSEEKRKREISLFFTRE
jgi:hypothetical protein